MAEYRFFDGDVPYVSTKQYHADRERAPHLEQPAHRGRLAQAAQLIQQMNPQSVVDLGCGDGGLLSLLSRPSWGYDFQPSNAEGWTQRAVAVTKLDFVANPDRIVWGELAVVTEVLEHLADPHGLVRLMSHNARYVVASSPNGETPEHHAEEHAWGWDMEGYQQMFNPDWIVTTHFTHDWCQIIGARSKHL